MVTAPEQMTDEALAELLDDLHEHEGATCPHCDGLLHGPTAYCWCAGCDACVRAREGAAQFEADMAALAAEWNRRHPQPPAPPAPATVPDDSEPF
jgi:hypothetical protein